MTSGSYTAFKERVQGKVNGHPRPKVAPAADDDRVAAYVAQAVEAEVSTLLATPEGSRNEVLNRAAFNLGTLAPRYLTERAIRAALGAAGASAGLTESETAKTIASGLQGAARAEPRVIDLGADWSVYVEEVSAEALLAEGEAFWTARPELAVLRDFALARMVSPWALLGVALVRVLTAVPPWIRLPPIVGGVGNLNLFVALIGESGTGKDAASAAAEEAVSIAGAEVHAVNLGSGEGIAHQYAHLEKPRGEDWEQVWDRHAVMFTVPEVDLLTALGNRHGSTLLGVLKSAFSGHRLGFAYADRTRRIELAANSYRLGLVLHAQPLVCGPLIDESAGGLPQRFVFLPSADPAITWPPPPAPPPLALPDQAWIARATVLTVPEVVRTTIGRVRADRAAGRKVERPTGGSVDLDGQSLYCREKVAQGLALLAGRRRMTAEDWDLSGRVMAVSDRTRAGIVAALAGQAARSEQARSVARGRARVTEDRIVADAFMVKAKARILRHLGEAGGSSPRREVLQLFDAVRRADGLEALELLEDAGHLEVVQAGRTVDVRLV